MTIYKNNYNYSTEEQVNDFGSVQSSIAVNLYQFSPVVGNGFLATATLTPGFSPATPSIASFSPVQGDIGDTVTVTGTGLAGITEININGMSQANLAVVDDTEASFVVAAGTTSGLITAVAPGGNGTSNLAFIIGGGNAGHVIQDDNDSFAARTNLKFIGNVTVTDDDVNDATIIDISGGTSASAGTFGEVTATTASLNQGEFETIDLDIAAISLIQEITITQASRLRLFGTDSDRAADTADVTTQLDIDEAIDLEFSSNLTRRFAMGIMANNLDAPTANILYAKLFNNSGAANNLNLTLKYYAISAVSALDNRITHWWKASNGVNHNNNLVSSWQDSISGKILTSSTNQPELINNWQGNQKAIKFTGNQYLQSSSINDFNTDIFTIFFVFDLLTTTNATEIMFRNNYTSTGNGNGSDLWGLFMSASGGQLSFHSRTDIANYVGVSFPKTVNNKIVLGLVWRDSDELEATINGTTFSVSGATANPSGHQFLRVGANSSSEIYFLNGHIRDLIFYAGVELSQSEINKNIDVLSNF